MTWVEVMKCRHSLSRHVGLNVTSPRHYLYIKKEKKKRKGHLLEPYSVLVCVFPRMPREHPCAHLIAFPMCNNTQNKK